MTRLTYKRLLKMNKEYLIEFLRQLENLPNAKHIGLDDLSIEQLEKYDNFYKQLISK